MYGVNQQLGAVAQAGGQVAQYARDMPTTGMDAAARQPEVVSEMERLSREVDRLGVLAETLTNRLQPVRRQTGNLAGKEQATPEPVLCGVASVIRQQRQNLEHHATVLQMALNELEI